MKYVRLGLHEHSLSGMVNIVLSIFIYVDCQENHFFKEKFLFFLNKNVK